MTALPERLRHQLKSLAQAEGTPVARFLPHFVFATGVVLLLLDCFSMSVSAGEKANNGLQIEELAAAEGLVARIAPKLAKRVTVEQISADQGRDVFEVFPGERPARHGPALKGRFLQPV